MIMWEKTCLTTGEAARFCGVNFRTVIRWIKRGHLRAYQLPGRGDNRIETKEFLAFLARNEMPVPEELRELMAATHPGRPPADSSR